MVLTRLSLLLRRWQPLFSKAKSRRKYCSCMTQGRSFPASSEFGKAASPPVSRLMEVGRKKGKSQVVLINEGIVTPIVVEVTGELRVPVAGLPAVRDKL